MYYERVLSAKEATFVNRAQQKISDLGVVLSEQATRGDIDQEHHQLIIELQYVIDSLRSTFLVWTEDEIEFVIDFYTLRGELVVYPYNQLIFTASLPSSTDVYATVVQLNAVDQASQARDTANAAFSQSERARLEQESIDRDNAIVAGIAGANFTTDLTSVVKLGGIDIGDEFLAGSPLEAAIRKLLAIPNDVDAFTFNGFTSLVEVGDTVSITLFSWAVSGFPLGLLLNDDGSNLINQVVTGSSYAPPSTLNYVFSTPKSIVWSLTGDNTTPRTKTVTSVYKSYYGKKAVANDDSLITVTESDILAGTGYLQVTSSEVTVQADTTNGEMGWIAVPKTQTAGDYTIWFVDTMNTAFIGIGEFISSPVDVSVNGVVYSVYRWSYRSPLTQPITLKR